MQWSNFHGLIKLSANVSGESMPHKSCFIDAKKNYNSKLPADENEVESKNMTTKLQLELKFHSLAEWYLYCDFPNRITVISKNLLQDMTRVIGIELHDSVKFQSIHT